MSEPMGRWDGDEEGLGCLVAIVPVVGTLLFVVSVLYVAVAIVKHLV